MSDEDFTPPDMNEKHKYLWRELRELIQLHQELASLYRTKSSDSKRKVILWNAIEQREALLFLEGVDVQ